MNLEVNISRSHVSSSNVMWQNLGQESCEKLHKNAQNTQINRETQHIFFYQFLNMQEYHKTAKNASRNT